MNNLLKLEISAENQTQADTILSALLTAKLVTGGQFIHAPARFLWKQEITDMDDYVTITSYTSSKHKAAIIEAVKGVASEEVPMVTFTTFEANPELETWIQETLT